MKKYIILGFASILSLLSSCDYNEKYFDGYDDITISNVAKYEGAYTGKYPTEGYFTDKTKLETSVNTMLKGIYKYCDKGSAAKVSVLYGDITAGAEKGRVPNESYVLTASDYDAMGTDKGFPGKYDNFDATMKVDSFLTAFCTKKYASSEVGTLVRVVYAYYASSVTATKFKFFEKTADGFAVTNVTSYATDIIYSLSTNDYDSMGTEGGTPGKYNNFDSNMDANFYLSIFLKSKYPYAKANQTSEILYLFFNSTTKVTSTKSALFKYDGTNWIAFDPYASILNVTTKIAEMTFDGSNWKLSRLLGGSVKFRMAVADYTTLVNWVKTNKNPYMSTQNQEEEYYFGASSKFNNINNKYSTWKTLYDVEKSYVGKTDEEMQAIMDVRIAEGISTVLLPNWVATPEPGFSYVVTYNVYGGRGSGNYVMSFMYNAETKKYDKVAGPVAE